MCLHMLRTITVQSFSNQCRDLNENDLGVDSSGSFWNRYERKCGSIVFALTIARYLGTAFCFSTLSKFSTDAVVHSLAGLQVA